MTSVQGVAILYSSSQNSLLKLPSQGLPLCGCIVAILYSSSQNSLTFRATDRHNPASRRNPLFIKSEFSLYLCLAHALHGRARKSQSFIHQVRILSPKWRVAVNVPSE